jgi:hypothetical protein
MFPKEEVHFISIVAFYVRENGHFPTFFNSLFCPTLINNFRLIFQVIEYNQNVEKLESLAHKLTSR